VGGGAPNARGQGTKVSQNAVTLDIQEAGFTLQKHVDGVVDLTMQEVFDPAKLKVALTEAGIKSDVQQVALPADWHDKTPMDCAASPGVERDEKASEAALDRHPVPGSKPYLYEFRPGQLPAADVVSLVRFDYLDSAKHQKSVSMLTILTGMPGPCTPVPAGSPEATRTRF